MLLSVRIEKTESISGQLGHDIDKRPPHANPLLKSNNFTFDKLTSIQIQDRIDTQTKMIMSDHGDMVTSRRKAVVDLGLDQKPQGLALSKIRGWRRDASTHKTMIVSFCNDFYLKQDQIDRKSLDQCMQKFADGFAEKNNCEIAYIVRHEDETTPHYHLTVTNYNNVEKTTHKFKQADLEALQDLAGDYFKSMGINRGIKKTERIRLAKTNEPEKAWDESDRDYKYRIKKAANTLHRNVETLHRDLPNELRKLNLEAENLRIAIDKNKKYLDTAKNTLAITENLNVEEIARYEKRIAAYKTRISNHEKTVSDLSTSIDLLNKKKEHLAEDIVSLSKIPFDIAAVEDFEVVTGRGVLGRAETKTMGLIRPDNHKKLVQQIDARSKKMDIFGADLDQRESNLTRRSVELEIKEKNIDDLIKNGISSYIRTNGLNISHQVASVAEHNLKRMHKIEPTSEISAHIKELATENIDDNIAQTM